MPQRGGAHVAHALWHAPRVCHVPSGAFAGARAQGRVAAGVEKRARQRIVAAQKAKNAAADRAAAAAAKKTKAYTKAQRKHLNDIVGGASGVPADISLLGEDAADLRATEKRNIEMWPGTSEVLDTVTTAVPVPWALT